jgi:hypothetical protein
MRRLSGIMITKEATMVTKAKPAAKKAAAARKAAAPAKPLPPAATGDHGGKNGKA